MLLSIQQILTKHLLYAKIVLDADNIVVNQTMSLPDQSRGSWTQKSLLPALNVEECLKWLNAQIQKQDKNLARCQDKKETIATAVSKHWVYKI